MRHTYRFGSIIGAKSAILGPSLPCAFFSHPTALGFTAPAPAPAISPLPISSTPRRLCQPSAAEDDLGISASRQQRTRSERVEDGYSACRYARRLRSGQPGYSASDEGSTKPTSLCELRSDQFQIRHWKLEIGNWKLGIECVIFIVLM